MSHICISLLDTGWSFTKNGTYFLNQQEGFLKEIGLQFLLIQNCSMFSGSDHASDINPPILYFLCPLPFYSVDDKVYQINSCVEEADITFRETLERGNRSNNSFFCLSLDCIYTTCYACGNGIYSSVFRHKLSLSDFPFSIQCDSIFFFSGKSSLWHLAEEMRLQWDIGDKEWQIKMTRLSYKIVIQWNEVFLAQSM